MPSNTEVVTGVSEVLNARALESYSPIARDKVY